MGILTALTLSLSVVLLFIALLLSFRKNPYSYGNIAMTSLMIFLGALMIGSHTMIIIENRSGEFSPLWNSALFLWEFSRVLLIPLCLLCLFLCISNVVLLRREGYRRNNFLGFMFSVFYLTMITITWIPLNSLPRAISAIIMFGRLMLCYAECTILAICIMGFSVLHIKPLHDRDFVIILGCSVRKKGKLLPLIRGRVDRAIHYAWEQEIKTGKHMRYVPSGGQGRDEPISEGSAMELYLLSHGAEEYEVFPEKKSRNTNENLLFSKRVIDRIMQNASVAVVTTNYHALRSGMLARRHWPDVKVVPSSTKWYFWPNAFFREIAAIIVMSAKVHMAVAVICGMIAVLMQYE